PALIGGHFRSGGLLRGTAEELRFKPAVLFLKKLDALFARRQASRDRGGVGGGRCGGLHGTRLYCTASCVPEPNTEKCSASCGFIHKSYSSSKPWSATPERVSTV